MKLKSSVLMILLLTTMLIVTFLGSSAYKRNKNNEIIPDDKPVDENIDNTPIVIDSFKGNINDNHNVPSEIMNLICDFRHLHQLDLDLLLLIQLAYIFLYPS